MSTLMLNLKVKQSQGEGNWVRVQLRSSTPLFGQFESESESFGRSCRLLASVVCLAVFVILVTGSTFRLSVSFG